MHSQFKIFAEPNNYFIRRIYECAAPRLSRLQLLYLKLFLNSILSEDCASPSLSQVQ